MTRLLALSFFLFPSLLSYSKIIPVKNIEELNSANRNAIPGDIIILQNGEWKNVTISLDCIGSKEKPVVIKAETPGKVLITGNSKLKIGGQYIIVDGLYFVNGYAGKDAVITFRTDNKHLANDCRVTNTVINDFNNPKRMDENNWVTFYGKNNELDHSSFIDKKNMGVLLAVILDDERSRENFHSIDHNYFGRRLPLASNGGEMIRVGLSQHCQFNSNTRINNNFFEECDGEAEIISIKSCANEVKGNVFKECQGSVVLRHGDNNIVKNNYFLGNDKAGSGGVRVINKGQQVSNNIFYKCRGVDFRSPLVIMNGVPNSPPTRYVQVTNAEIIYNFFYECSPLALCEGSDAERTLPPDNVLFTKNLFHNTRDSIIYKAFDDINGIRFSDNIVNNKIEQRLIDGFIKENLPVNKFLSEKERVAIGYRSIDNIDFTQGEVFKKSGTSWFKKSFNADKKKVAIISCATAEDLYKQLEKREPMMIRLTGENYFFNKPAFISSNIEIQPAHKGIINFASASNIFSVFMIDGNATFKISHTHINAEEVKAKNFISSDTSGSSEHYSFIFDKSSIFGLRSAYFFYSYKSSLADSIIIRASTFNKCRTNLLTMADEKEDKGYYNIEKISMTHNNFDKLDGYLLNIYRGGSDESTLGPDLTFSHNKLSDCYGDKPLITLTGAQVTNIFSNNFSNCNPTLTLLSYKDMVRAKHNFERNTLTNSGKIEENVFVTERGNTIR